MNKVSWNIILKKIDDKIVLNDIHAINMQFVLKLSETFTFL